MHYAYATLVSRQPEIFSRRVPVEAIMHAHWHAYDGRFCVRHDH